MNRDKVATVTVTYNRKELLKNNINSILNQSYEVDCIIIVDNNSNDGTKELIKNEFGDNDKIKYIFLDENIGGAGGFYTGCEYAFKNEYDWIILMDDDGKPKDNRTIENLMKEITNKRLSAEEHVMLNSLVVCDDNNLSFGLFSSEDKIKDIILKSNDNVILKYINPFNGTLISKALIEEIGFPNKDFFIKGDEHDYYCRAMKANAYIATVVDSVYFHPKIVEKNKKKIKIFNKEFHFFIEAPWKEFYRIRNYTYIYIKENNYKKAKKEFIKRLIGALVCKCRKIETIKMIIKGYKDGKNNKLGATVKP